MKRGPNKNAAFDAILAAVQPKRQGFEGTLGTGCFGCFWALNKNRTRYLGDVARKTRTTYPLDAILDQAYPKRRQKTWFEGRVDSVERPK